MTRALFRSQIDAAPDPLLAFGRMSSAVKHLSRQLSQLPCGNTDYYGTLQTMRTAAIAITVDLGYLIDGCERANQPIEPVLEVVRAHSLPTSEQPPAREPKRRGRPPRTEPGPKPAPVAAEGEPRVTVRDKILRFLSAKGPANTSRVRNHLSQQGHELDLGPVEQHLYNAKGAGKVIEADGLWSVLP